MAKVTCEKEQQHEKAVARAVEELPFSDLEKLCAVFRMLSDPTRMKIVLALTKGGMCVYHIAEVTGGTVSGVSHQLRILKDNNVVKAERFGKNVEYSIADKHVEKIIQTAIEHLHC